MGGAGPRPSLRTVESELADERARIAAEVTLALLEAIKTRDRPQEILGDEDIHRTMPRRFGLSAVVERQIELFRERARRGVRMTTSELAEFMRLVIRRPDSAEIFHEMGAELATKRMPPRSWWLPRFLRLRKTKRHIRKSLRRLFGRRIGGFATGTFVFEVSASPFVQLDASGDACEIVTGFCQKALEKGVDPRMKVAMRRCETEGDGVCRWVAEYGG